MLVSLLKNTVSCLHYHEACLNILTSQVGIVLQKNFYAFALRHQAQHQFYGDSHAADYWFPPEDFGIGSNAF